MNARFVILAALVLAGSLSPTAAGAVKMDPELTSRLSATPATKQLGVILTFNGQRVTDAQVNAVKALGAKCKTALVISRYKDVHKGWCCTRKFFRRVPPTP